MLNMKVVILLLKNVDKNTIMPEVFLLSELCFWEDKKKKCTKNSLKGNIPRAEESKSSLELPRESKRDNTRLSEPQTDPNHEKIVPTRTNTALNSHHISYSDIPVINFITTPSAKPKKVLNTFLMALIAVAIYLAAFSGRFAEHHAYSLNKQPPLLQTSPYTPDSGSIQRNDHVHKPTPSLHTENLGTRKVSQQIGAQNHAFEPG